MWPMSCARQRKFVTKVKIEPHTSKRAAFFAAFLLGYLY
jgi:hypothetical protein